MKSLSEGMHVTTNNLANCSTIGFKSQMALYSDLIYEEQANPGEWNFNQENSQIAVGQHGMGVRVDEIATNFTQGALESTNATSDLAISGKGYFVVQNEYGKTFYTRAGDFIVDNEGTMRNPAGLTLMGYQTGTTSNSSSSSNANNSSSNQLQPINLDNFKTLSPKATSKISVTDTNVVPSSNVSMNEANPWFSMLSGYDATTGVGLGSSQYSNSQSVNIYDGKGQPHQVTIYYDGTQDSTDGFSVEFLVAEDLEEAGTNAGDGLLMSGVLQFDSAGQLANIAAYTPTQAGSTDLDDWAQASVSKDGYPQFSYNGKMVSMDFGITSKTTTVNRNATAADVGTNKNRLATLDKPSTGKAGITGYNSSGFTDSISQNGYAEGQLSNYQIDNNGKVYGNFSNGESRELWQIPLARFTSDDGLMRAGGNLFAATSEAGTITLGAAGSENFGTIESHYIEQSNVDIANEMVTMIITQRGFQSNSKVVTTSDEMLRTAINLKQR